MGLNACEISCKDPVATDRPQRNEQIGLSACACGISCGRPVATGASQGNERAGPSACEKICEIPRDGPRIDTVGSLIEVVTEGVHGLDQAPEWEE